MPPPQFDWLRYRDHTEQLRHHLENQGEAATRYGDTLSGDYSRQLTVLAWNAGNIDRPGISPNGLSQASLVVPFICGKHHLALIQESFSQYAWRDFNTHGFRYAYSSIETCDRDSNGYLVHEPGNLMILAGASGRKRISVIDQGSIVNPRVTNEKKIRGERLWYLAGLLLNT